jgi:DNA-binding PadR family transcriptional regulator
MHRHAFFRHACARRAHAPSFEHFGSPFGRHGGRGFMGGRKLGAEDLQLVILALLAEQPRHGYEIIKQLEEVSRGFYAPSPGMVYPALTFLEEVGQATVETEGARKRYHITDAGRARLAEQRDFVDAVLAQLARAGSRMERMRQAFAGEERHPDEEVGHAAVDRARRALRNALIARLSAAPTAEALAEIARILEETTEALRKR